MSKSLSGRINSGKSGAALSDQTRRIGFEPRPNSNPRHVPPQLRRSYEIGSHVCGRTKRIGGTDRGRTDRKVRPFNRHTHRRTNPWYDGAGGAIVPFNWVWA